jgi:hypothetical protein
MLVYQNTSVPKYKCTKMVVYQNTSVLKYSFINGAFTQPDVLEGGYSQ